LTNLHYIPEDGIPHSRYCENLASCIQVLPVDVIGQAAELAFAIKMPLL
jgi:hypothetical protein